MTAEYLKYIQEELDKSIKKLDNFINNNDLKDFVEYQVRTKNILSFSKGLLNKLDKSGNIKEKELKVIDGNIFILESDLEDYKDNHQLYIKKLTAVFKDCEQNFIKINKICDKLKAELKSVKPIG
jgi:hypothetical protein